MTRFVVGSVAFLFLADNHAAPLGAHHDLVLGQFKVMHVDFFLVVARREKRRLVNQVFQVGASKPRSGTGQHADIDVGRDGHFAQMHLQDAFAPLYVRPRHHHSSVETAGAKQGRVQNVRAVSGGDKNDAFVGLKTVHLNEQLVEGLLALVVAAAKTGAAMASDSVDFIDEDDARSVFFTLNKQIAHPGGADADKHFDEVRPPDPKDRPARLTGNSPRQ